MSIRKYMFIALVLICLCGVLMLPTYATEPEALAEEPEITEDAVTGDVVEEPEPDYEPIEGEISDGQYKAYVLGCLFFFVVVILAKYCCKFIGMFF